MVHAVLVIVLRALAVFAFTAEVVDQAAHDAVAGAEVLDKGTDGATVPLPSWELVMESVVGMKPSRTLKLVWLRDATAF
jgi:hypothetical protein